MFSLEQRPQFSSAFGCAYVSEQRGPTEVGFQSKTVVQSVHVSADSTLGRIQSGGMDWLFMSYSPVAHLPVQFNPQMNLAHELYNTTQYNPMCGKRANEKIFLIWIKTLMQKIIYVFIIDS